jgi:hypothetical protein
MLSFNRQAFLVDGKYKFWGGMVMNMIGMSHVTIVNDSLQAN